MDTSTSMAGGENCDAHAAAAAAIAAADANAAGNDGTENPDY
jgi:hypothetical protein